MAAIDFNGLWAETVATVRREGELLLPVAGLLLFVPQLLLSWQMGGMPLGELSRDPQLMAGLLPVLLLVLLVTTFGQTVIVMLVAGGPDGAGISVGDALRLSIRLLPLVLLASVLQGFAIGAGLLLLILPGLYIAARLVVVIPIIVAGRVRDPIGVLRESWTLTSGNGLRILFMLSLLLAGFLLVGIVVGGLGAALGFVSNMAAGVPDKGWSVGRWIIEVLSTGASTAISIFYLAFTFVLYRALSNTRP